MQQFKHQQEGIAYLKKQKKAILADEMGLGKTLQAIMAAGETANGDVLIVCPASLKLNWKREIERLYPEDVIYIYGSDEHMRGDTVWFIINYDILEKNMSQLDIHPWHTVILDESHYIKNASKRTNNSLKLCAGAKQVYLLTGTMVQNKPMELYNQLKAIDHPLTRSAKGKEWHTYTSFGRRYCAGYQVDYGHGMFWNFEGASHLDELREKIAPFYLRRKKEDVLDMPPKLVQIRSVEMTAEWQKKYDRAFQDYIEWLESNPDILEEKNLENIMAVQHLVELSKVKQVASLAKVENIAEDIKAMLEAGEKVVIFTVYKETMSALKKAIGPKYRKVELTGSTSINKRQEAVDQFQTDPKTMCFMGNIEAAGVGITLTAANKVVFADLDWNPANHAQAEDRCHRIGQQGTVNVYYYAAKDTIDEDVLEMLDQKRAIIDAIMEGTDIKKQGRGAAKDLIQKLSTKAVANKL